MIHDTENTALLVMDVQSAIIDRLKNKDEYVENIKKAVAAAHLKDILVIYVVVGFRPGAPEIGPHNKMFSSIRESASVSMVHPQPVITPTEKDVVLTKRRFSAFTGSDLEVILRAHRIHHLVLAGVVTSGVVLSTVREASDKDYKLTVLSDLCVDHDEEVHRVLIEKVFPRQAEVITSAEWIGAGL